MAGVVTDLETKLIYTTRAEVEKYAVDSFSGKMYSILDDVRRHYAVVIVLDKREQLSTWVVIFARVVGDYVVIEEDTTDKPLVDALMINGGIPREKIVLAYAGETIPTEASE